MASVLIALKNKGFDVMVTCERNLKCWRTQNVRLSICIYLVLLLPQVKPFAAVRRPDASKVRFEIVRFSKDAGLLHWKITNKSDEGVYIYSFFLLGVAYNIERSPGKLIFDTSPIVRVASCPPKGSRRFFFSSCEAVV